MDTVTNKNTRIFAAFVSLNPLLWAKSKFSAYTERSRYGASNGVSCVEICPAILEIAGGAGQNLQQVSPPPPQQVNVILADCKE